MNDASQNDSRTCYLFDEFEKSDGPGSMVDGSIDSERNGLSPLPGPGRVEIRSRFKLLSTVHA